MYVFSIKWNQSILLIWFTLTLAFVICNFTCSALKKNMFINWVCELFEDSCSFYSSFFRTTILLYDSVYMLWWILLILNFISLLKTSLWICILCLRRWHVLRWTWWSPRSNLWRKMSGNGRLLLHIIWWSLWKMFRLRRYHLKFFLSISRN